jgi:ABC-type Zn uptake system ZnuABC Zn-binding protein ZnuA
MRKPLLFVLSVFVLGVSCGPAPRPTVFASIPLIKTTLDPIVKDYVEVIPLLDASVDPFRPPPDISLPAEGMTRAYQMILLGGGVDDWLADLVRRKRGALQPLTTVETPSYIGGSPCIWLSAGDARLWVDNLLTALNRVDKKHAAEFAQNALLIKDQINEFFHDLRWFRIPKGKKTFLQYSVCTTYVLLAVGPLAVPPIADAPTDLPPEEKLTQGFKDFVNGLGDHAILATLTVDNPEGIKILTDLFPRLKVLQLKTFPHEISPTATLLDLLSYNTDRILEADQ